VLSKTRYPASKSTLLKKVGWKLVEIEKGRQVRLEKILEKIPSRTYNDIEEVVKEIKKFIVS